VPYGISDQVWQYLDPQTQQGIIDAYGGSTQVGGSGGAVPGSWPDDQPLPDPYLLDLGYSTPESQQQALAEIMGAGYTYDQFIEEFFGSGTSTSTQSGSSGGGGGFIQDIGPAGPLAPISATFSPYEHQIASAPEWWKALAPDVINPVSEYQTLSNLLIPFLSPEDQRTVATNLYQSNPTQFSHLNPELLEGLQPATEITPQLRTQFFTGERAQNALTAFDELLSISGKSPDDFGPGYNFLRGLADTVKDYRLTSGASQLTETQQGQLLSALDPMLAQTESRELSAFGPLARSFVNPFFSAGSLTGQVRNKFGDLIRPPNPRYF